MLGLDQPVSLTSFWFRIQLNL